MLSFLAFLALAASVAQGGLVFPAYRGVPAGTGVPYNFNGTITPSESIASSIYQTSQKSGPPADAAPNFPVVQTTIIAVDEDLVNATVPPIRRGLPLQVQLPSNYDLLFWDKGIDTDNSDYELAFSGTGTGPEDRDGSILGTAYLTYTLVDNSTYNIEQCLEFCDNIPGCVFVNLYYEFNNGLLDHVFSEHSNLRCVAYGDVHSADEKLNFGGQSLSGSALTYIQQSTGWTRKYSRDVSTPDGYELVGEYDGADEAPGYMGFVFLDRYDVEACAAVCNIRDADAVGGSCKYFNIWRAVVNGVPATYTCTMYYISPDASTAINLGQGSLTITDSRGYRRKTALLDGGFEQYKCNEGLEFCFTHTTDNWLASSPWEGYYDASIFHYQPYAHTGNSVGLLGSAYGYDQYPGTLTSLARTQEGVKYIIEFFHSSFYSGQAGEADAFLEVYWNANLVGTIRPGFSQWTYYNFTVLGHGNDQLDFVGGKAPSLDFIDDIFVMQT